jgi:hypothetical protein
MGKPPMLDNADIIRRGRAFAVGPARRTSSATRPPPARPYANWSVRQIVLVSFRQSHFSPFPAVGEGGRGDDHGPRSVAEWEGGMPAITAQDLPDEPLIPLPCCRASRTGMGNTPALLSGVPHGYG